MDITIVGLNYHERENGRKVLINRGDSIPSTPPPISFEIIFELNFCISVWNHKHYGFLCRILRTKELFLSPPSRWKSFFDLNFCISVWKHYGFLCRILRTKVFLGGKLIIGR